MSTHIAHRDSSRRLAPQGIFWVYMMLGPCVWCFSFLHADETVKSSPVFSKALLLLTHFTTLKAKLHTIYTFSKFDYFSVFIF